MSGSWDRTIKLWDVASGRERGSFNLDRRSDTINSVAFSPDGHTVLSLSNRPASILKLWDITSGREIRTFIGHSGTVHSAAFSPDGRTVVSVRWDESNEKATVPLWDVASGHELRTFAAHSFDDDFNVFSVAFSPDGHTALFGSRAIRLWDIASGHELKTFRGGADAKMGTATDPMASDIYSVAFSPDGRTVLSGSEDHTVKLWDVASGREVRTFTGHSESVSSVAFSPDGHTALSGSRDETIKLWDVASGRELRTFAGHSDYVWSVAFSPGGRTVVSGSGDGTVKLWDIASGNELSTFTGHSGKVESVAFSSDGRVVLSGGDDGSIRLWDKATGQMLTRSMSYRDGSWLTITPEGFFDASSPKATENFSVVRGLDVCSTDRVYSILHRPDLVREKMAGDPDSKVKAAAAQLDLDKVCFGTHSEQDQQRRMESDQRPQ